MKLDPDPQFNSFENLKTLLVFQEFASTKGKVIVF